MSAIVSAAAALLDASYEVGDATKAYIWRYMAIEAHHEHDRLQAKYNAAKSKYRFIIKQAAEQKLDRYRELTARAVAAESERDKAREERDDAREALANIVRRCPRHCTRGSYCGACAVALVALPDGYKLVSEHVR